MKLLINGLAFGWLSGNFAALANLPLWFSWALRDGTHEQSLVPMNLSLATFQLLVQGLWFDEAASKVCYLAAPHLGNFCWIGSMAVILISSYKALQMRSLKVIFKPGESAL